MCNGAFFISRISIRKQHSILKSWSFNKRYKENNIRKRFPILIQSRLVVSFEQKHDWNGYSPLYTIYYKRLKAEQLDSEFIFHV